MPLPPPITREVVLIGGGHTHALVLRKWGMDPLPGVRLTVINPAPTAPYTGMLPGFVAGHYKRAELDIDLMRLARFAGARLIRGIVTTIDADAKRLTIAGRGELSFDLASIDIGITSENTEIKGFSEFGVGAKPLGPYANKWATFLASGGGPVAVIGAGLGGTELAMAMAYAMREAGHAHPVTLIDSASLTPELPLAARQTLRRALDAQGVDLKEGAEVAEITRDCVLLKSGEVLPSTLTVTATGARPWAWLQETGLKINDGFIRVDAHLRSLSHGAIYACGDCADLSHAPRPKAGVFAVRAAPILFHNLRADLTGRARRAFHPQRDYLKLVSLGEQSALALRSGLHASGPALWRWKNRIDRRFMDRLSDLPAMTSSDPRSDQRLCAGCGSKVGRVALDAAISDLPQPRDDVETAAGDDAAVLKVGTARQVLSTDHLRDFTNDPALLARIAAFHALGDVWAMGATPQVALTSIVLPPLSPRLQEAWLSEIMDSAGRAFESAGAQIVGGHTTQGAALTIGYTVPGLLSDAPLTLAGAKPGDALILTRPLGSGVLLAADMALKGRGPDLALALDAMATSQADAAARLGQSATALTDVTGFGLAGHLAAMANASNIGAEIWLEALPIYPGALHLAERGIRSTLYPDNLAAAALVAPQGPRTDLLFDPQTAGGFLAAIPIEQVDTVLQDIRDMGHDAAQIGEMRPASDGLTAR